MTRKKITEVRWTPEQMAKNNAQHTQAGYDKGKEQGMTQGIALAVALMYKGEDEKGIWKACGMSLHECIKQEVAEYDLDELVKHWKELDGIDGGNY